MSRHFLTKFFRMTFKILFCWSISLEMFKGKSSESTIPRMKLRYSGIKSRQSSMMKTLRTYSLMLFSFFRDSKRSNGALLGTNNNAVNSNWPSTEKCFTDICSSQSLVKAYTRDLGKDLDWL